MNTRTLADIELAEVYFEILVGLAMTSKGQTITYSRLVELAKEKYPDNPFVSGALAISTGRRLGALREFTSHSKYPDLSALVVSQADGENGEGFSRWFDGDAVREQVAAFDWSEVKPRFGGFITSEKLALEQRQSRARKPKKVKEPDALEMLLNWGKEHKINLRSLTHYDRAAMVKLIMQGYDPKQAYSQVLAKRQ